MLWKNRLLAAVLAAAVTAALTAALCFFGSERSPYVPAPMEGGLTRAAVGVAPGEIVMRVDGNEAPAELLTYEIGYNCAYLDYLLSQRGEGPFDPDGLLPDGQSASEYVWSESLLMLKQQLALENLAARCGVTLSEEDEAAIAAGRQSYVDELGEAGYRAELYKLGVSESGFERISRAAYLYAALYEAYSTPGTELYAGDDALRAYAEGSGYITADHILIPTVDLSTREKLDERTIEKNRALAEDLLSQLRRSRDPIETFAELADRYSEDTGRAANPDGYTFAPGTMVSEFDSAARALREGEISGVVESQYGYHIILRRPLDARKAAEAVRGEYFDAFLNAEVENARHELTDAAKRFDVARVWKAFSDANGRG